MNFLSLVAFFAVIVYLFIGIYTYRLDRYSHLNRIFSLLCLDFALWAFAYTFLYSAPDKQSVWFWYRMSSPGWCFFPALTLHFFIILTGHKDILKHWWIYMILYIPGTVFFFKTLTGTLLVSDFVYRGLGWCEIAPSGSVWFWLYALYYFSFIVAWFIPTLKWHATAPSIREKKQARVILTVAFPVLFGSITTDTILPSLDIYLLPSVASILILFWIAGIWYAIVKYKLMDITTAVAAEDIVATMYDLLVLTDHEGKIIKLNRRTIDLIGCDEVGLIGKPLEILFADAEIFREKFDGAHRMEHPARCEMDLLTRYEEVIPLNLTCSLIRDNSGEPIGYAVVGQDLRQIRELQAEITNRKTAEARLQYMTLFDPVTGLPNRKLFYDRMTQIIENTARSKTACALLLIEIKVAGNIGIVGSSGISDRLMKEIAARLEKYVRDSDMAARISEYEFVVMIAGIRGSSEVQRLADTICVALSRPYQISNKTVLIDMEIGIGIYPVDGESVDTLLKTALRDKHPVNKILFYTDAAASYSSE